MRDPLPLSCVFCLFTVLSSVSLMSFRWHHCRDSSALAVHPDFSFLLPGLPQRVSPLPSLTLPPHTGGRSFCPLCTQGSPCLCLGPCCLSECPPHRSPGLCFALSKVVLLRKVWKLLFRNVPLPPIAVDSSLEFYAMHTGPLQHPGPVFPPCFLLLFCCIHCSGCVVRLLVSMLACVLCFCTSLT